MGRTFVEGTITGPSASKQYRFFVDTGAALMGCLNGKSMPWAWKW